MEENIFCGEHSGHKADIKALCKFKDKMTDPGGTVERLWKSINSKIGKGMLITFTILIVTVLCTLYGLTYHTQGKILDQMSAIKTDIAVIKEKIR